MKIGYIIRAAAVFLVILAMSLSFLFIPSGTGLNAAGNGIKVFIDPGHGGRDPGAVRNGLNEKDANLAIALKLKSKLEAAGFTVVMRRSGDQYSTLDEIVDLANRSGADIFVSIHNNAALSSAAQGTETYWCANGVNGSNQLAGYIQSNLVSQINRANRGVKTANFRVIKYTTMPAALVECAFVSNPTEAELLKSSSFQDKCATGIFNGISRFAQGINKATGDYVDTSGTSSAGFTVIIDEPASNATISSGFQISGWAADLINLPPKKLAKVEIYKGLERTAENLLGQAGRFNRPDLGRQDILESGYVLKIGIDSLSKGENLLYVYAYDHYGNYSYRPVKINVIKEEASQEAPNEIPIANPGGPYSGKVGEAITFNGSGSTDPDGQIAEYIWDFGDGDTGTGADTGHIYQAAGTFTVSLKVKDNDGAYSSTVICEAVIVEEAADTPPDTGDGDDQAVPVLETISNSTDVTGYIDVTVEQLVKLFTDRDSPQVERAARLAQLYIDYGKLFDIRADIAWAQMCYSTGFLEFAGNIALEQNNFCAMGAIGTSCGNSFDTEELGVIAHYAHLAWYYYPVHVNEYCSSQYDPRHFGSSHYRYTGDTTLGHLNGRWSSRSTYTDRIIEYANEVIQAMGSETSGHVVTADAGEDISANKGDEVTLDASGSVVYPVSETQSVTYEWDWESDGEYDVSTQDALISHIFDEPGTYEVSLRITAFDNIQSIDSLTATVNDPPTAHPGGPYEAAAGEEITFDGSASSDSDGTIAQYDWDFGDGSTGTGETAVHSYDQAGTYTVTLTVTDDAGAASDVASVDAVISEADADDAGEEEDGDSVQEDNETQEENIYNIGSPGAGFTIVIDYPARGAIIDDDFNISGWAADLIHSSPKKWVRAEIYKDSYRSKDSYLGQAIKYNRPDLGRKDILDSGYMWTIYTGSLADGSNTLYVYVYDAAGRYTFHSVTVTVVKGEQDPGQEDPGGDAGSEQDSQGDEGVVQNPVTGPISNSTSVVGYKDVTAEQLVGIFASRNPSQTGWASRLAPIYIQYGQLFNIRADIAWAQMCHETGFLAYTGDVQPHQNNFAGLGATGGVPGNSFATEELGIIAHYAHLAWYYYPDHVNEYCSSQYDPRHFGTGHYKYTGDTSLGFLNGRWAPGSTYTNKIILFANEIFGY